VARQEIELVDAPSLGRVFTRMSRVRLGDVTPTGRLRLDAIARMLQDISGDDTADASLPETGIWVLRRLGLRVEHLPSLDADVELRTWCSGTGPRWAERRTDIGAGGTRRVGAAAIWAYTDRDSSAPVGLPESFHATFGGSALHRRVSARLDLAAPPHDAPVRSWPTRATDFDVLGHVNNANYWAPIEETLAGRSARIAGAVIEFRGGVGPDDAVHLAEVANERELRQWWLVDGDVRASCLVEFGP
jgi:acyl-ACP thioesterase